MASKRLLKQRINLICEELFAECVAHFRFERRCKLSCAESFLLHIFRTQSAAERKSCPDKKKSSVQIREITEPGILKGYEWRHARSKE